MAVAGATGAPFVGTLAAVVDVAALDGGGVAAGTAAEKLGVGVGALASAVTVGVEVAAVCDALLVVDAGIVGGRVDACVEDAVVDPGAGCVVTTIGCGLTAIAVAGPLLLALLATDTGAVAIVAGVVGTADRAVEVAALVACTGATGADFGVATAT